MDIDPDISNWILEFLLKQPLEDRTIDTLLRTLPLPNNNPDFQKSILLKKLESDASRKSFSESAIELLEQLEEIEYRRGIETVSDAMKHAYCAVAVECTVKLLTVENGPENSCKFEFFAAVNKLWRGRIGRMEKVLGKGGLGSDELWIWKDEIDAAVWDDSVCESVVKKSESVNAVEAVRIYVKEEREKMGHSFLELVAERVGDDSVLQEIVGVGNVDGGTEKEASPARADPDTMSNEAHKEKSQRRNKFVDSKRPKELSSRNHRGTKIVDSHEMLVGPSHKNFNLPRSAEVNKVREALESSSMALQEVVKDPLPDALRMAEAVSGMARKDEGDGPLKENNTKASVFVVDSAGVIQAPHCNTSIITRLSLMERNNTARTYEWTESVDDSQEDSANRGDRLQLPSPRTIDISPLDKYEIKNLKKRRKRREWSPLEEDTLRIGVETYGRGNWKVILRAYKDIFEDRTYVDLKDKWRNLTRY